MLGAALRGVPELLVPYYPVGYETITYYAPALMLTKGQNLLIIFQKFFREGPLFYVFGSGVIDLTGADPFLLLKITGPLLYGILLFSFFMFLRRGMKLEWRMAFVAALLLSVQVAALRESWDRFRTILGLVFLFWAFTVLRSDNNDQRRWLLVGVLSVLTVLSREYVGLVLFAAVLGYAILERRSRLASLTALAPALAVFSVMSFPLWQFSDYFSGENLFVTGGYSWMVQDAFSIFAVCYLPLLFFVARGIMKDRLIGSVTGWLVLGSFSFVVSPWFAVPGYQRWLMLLVFPFVVYAVKGFERLNLFTTKRIKILTAIVLVFVVIGSGYSSGWFSYTGLLPNTYVAANMVQSSIPWSQVDDLQLVLRWFDKNAPVNSTLILEEKFYGWTLIYLDRAKVDIVVIPFSADSPAWGLKVALQQAQERSHVSIWTISLTDSGIDGFRSIYAQNSISAFEYQMPTTSYLLQS